MATERGFRLLPDDPEVGRVPYLWLMYLVFVFLGPPLMHAAGEIWVWVGTVVSVLLFVPLYFVGYWVEGRRLLLVSTGIMVVGMATAWFNTGGNTYFIFAAYFAGYAAETRGQGVRYLLSTLSGLAFTSVLIQPSPYFWIPAVAGSCVIGLLGIELRQRVQQNADLRIARAEVAALARIAERERIGRDLHDLLGQSLSVVSLKAELARRLVEADPERAAVELKDIQDVARQSLSEVRTAVRGYRVSQGSGLRFELDNARRALDAAGVELECPEDLSPLAKRLDAEHEAVVALALREGVTNVVRHAGAAACTVRFVLDADTYGVEICDDGRGGLGASLGAGLQGMRERVESLGGQLELRTRPGMTIRLTFAAEAA